MSGERETVDVDLSAIMLDEKTIHVWAFWEAPAVLRELSDHGGDEDWVALVPPARVNSWIGWAETGTPFGVSAVAFYPFADGWEVRIGAHS